MTKDELNDLIQSGTKLDEIVPKLQNDSAPIESYESLKDLTIENVEKDDFLQAIDLLEVLQNDQADWYIYDVSMGTLEDPRPVHRAEDLFDLCDW